MLVLSRKLQQEILIGDNVKITVLKVKGNTVRLGIEAPKSVRVVRGELTPVEEPMATVTVVFDENSIVQETTPTRSIVPFEDSAKSAREPDPGKTSRMDTSHPNGPTSISFNSRIPEPIQHNRLKQIVKEITNKKR